MVEHTLHMPSQCSKTCSQASENNDNLVEADGPAKENWEFCIFEVRKKKYRVFKNGISDKLNIPLGPDDETLIMCFNFKKSELKTLLIDKLNVNPIMFYECMLLSPIDKVYEFDDMSIFYNMVINCCSYNIPPPPQVRGVYKPENFVKFFPKVYPRYPL